MSRASDSIVDGITLRQRPGPSGDVLVMLHGIGSDRTSFDRLSALLPTDLTLLAWNAPGYAGSAPLATARPMAAEYAGRLHGLLDVLKTGAVTLLGHSLGTLIATEFAALYPNRVNRLILLACAQGYGIAPDAPLPDKAARRLADLEHLGAAEFAHRRAPRLMHRPTAQPEICAEATRAMAAIVPDGYAQAVHMLARGDLAASARRVRSDSLVLVGADDRITPPDQSQRTHDALQNAAPALSHRFARVSGAGHILHQERPGPVADHIAAFAGWAKT